LALRRFAKPMSGAEVDQYLSTTFRPLLAVHSSHGLYGPALQLATTHRLSWYDSLIVSSAMEGRCRILYSEDFQHGQRFSDLRIENPFL
jgi:predicted nucleic acid-binding protein